jgi:hypothetical protein
VTDKAKKSAIIIPFPSCTHIKSKVPSRKVPEGDALAWRRKQGLLTLSDYASDYEAIRQSRGPYAVSLPEDLR